MKLPKPYRYAAPLVVLTMLLCVRFGVLPVVAQSPQTPQNSPRLMARYGSDKLALRAAAEPAAARLTYHLETGKSYRYKVTAFFSGHIPPLAQPGSEPAHIRVRLDYLATVIKQDDAAAEVKFEVDAGDISLLTKDPGPKGKIDPKDEFPWPISLAQLKQTLDAVATVKPDGSIVAIKGVEGSSPVRINFGIDPRKLFLLILPVAFPDRSLRVKDEWTFEDGILGRRPGQTSYRGRLLAIKPDKKQTAFQIAQSAESLVNDKLDGEGNYTDKPEEAKGTLTGKVTLTGTLRLVTLPPDLRSASAAPDLRVGRLADGQMILKGLFTRVLPDPNSANDSKRMVESTLDIQGRLSVKADDAPIQPAAAAVTGGASSVAGNNGRR